MSGKSFFVGDIPRRKFLEMGVKGGLAIAASPVLIKELLAKAGPGDLPAAGPALDKAMLDRVVARALDKGGEFADVYVEHRISRNILMEESKFKKRRVRHQPGRRRPGHRRRQNGIRLHGRNRRGGLLRAAEVASFIARGSAAVTPGPGPGGHRPPVYITVKLPLGRNRRREAAGRLRRANQAALDHDKRIKMASVSYYDEVRGRTIANSEGLYLSDELPLLFFIVQVLSEGNNTRHMGRERLSRHSGFEMFDEVTPEQVARTAAREAIVMLEAKDAPAGKMDVVMQNGWGGVLVHEAVGHPARGRQHRQEDRRLHRQARPEGRQRRLHHDRRRDAPQFPGDDQLRRRGDAGEAERPDREGRSGQVHDRHPVGQADRQERTGNGRRESFRYLPIPRMTNTFIDKGKDKPADILASTKSGIYVQGLSGGSVDPTTGVFNFTCREAYLIEDGRKTTPVKGATLIGNCLEIIQNIDAVGDDLDFGPGICGKGQAAEVTAGQPTVRIRGINVGGTRARG